MSFVPALELLFAAFAVAMNLALLAGIFVLLVPTLRAKAIDCIRRYARLFVFLLAAGAMIGSLTLQYAAALNPCVLCWWQRIFMYPTVVIAAIAMIKGSDFSEIADYVLGLSILGAIVALYQHLLQMLPAGSLIPCDSSGDCAIRSFYEFGYVTFPWMALSVFALLIFIGIVARKKM